MFKSKESVTITNLKNDISALQIQLDNYKSENASLRIKTENSIIWTLLNEKQAFILKTKKLIEEQLKLSSSNITNQKLRNLLAHIEKEATSKIPENLQPDTPKTQDTDDQNDDSQSEDDIIITATPQDPVSVRKHKKLIYPPKPRDFSTLVRENFSFELELKEYSKDSFEDIKEFVAKTNITSLMIDEKIEEISDKMEKISYFKSIFPQRTKEKCADHLENYLFEVLYHRIFKPTEDAKMFAQQLKERLFVLRNIVTFEMLDIPSQVQDLVLFESAVKEFDKMAKLKSPLLKLEALQNCANVLIEAYIDATERQPDANELFPMLTYVILNSEIEHLKIQSDFIVNYLRGELSFGQLGFLAINFKAILQFLNDVDGSVLIKEGKLSVKKLCQDTPC